MNKHVDVESLILDDLKPYRQRGTRAWNQVHRMFRWSWRKILTPWFWFWMPRPGYCMRCGDWCWLTNERPAYSAYDGAFICEPCAIDNDEDTAYAWREYYAGCL